MQLHNKEGNGRDSNRVPLYEVVPLAVPFSVGIGVSDPCNFKCIYCAHSIGSPIKNEKERIIKWDEFVFMIDNIEEMYNTKGGGY